MQKATATGKKAPEAPAAPDLTLDEILRLGAQAPAPVPPAKPPGVLSAHELTEKQLATLPNVQAMLGKEVNRARWETVEQDSAYFVGALLSAIETLTQGNILASGRALDDALTHYLADLGARTGDGFVGHAAALLIRNIALFLPPLQRDAVMGAIDAAARPK